MSDKNKTVKLAGRKGTKVSKDKAKSFSDVQNKQKHNRKAVKVYDSDTGRYTTLQKEGNTYYRGGQYIELTDSQKEVKGASMKKYGASQKKFPEIKKGNEGKFTRWVEKNMPGMDTCKAASKIMRSRTKKYSPAVVKMANYANNFGCKTKKEDGPSIKGGRRKTSIDNKKTETLKRKSFRRADGSAKLKQRQVTDDGTIRKTRKIEKSPEKKGGRHINKTVKIKSKDGVEVRKTKHRSNKTGSITEKTSYYRPKGSLKKMNKKRTATAKGVM